MNRIYVDFNTMMSDPQERVLINPFALEYQTHHLQQGAVILLYDEELEVEATLEFDEQPRLWWGIPDWTTRRDLLPTHEPTYGSGKAGEVKGWR